MNEKKLLAKAIRLAAKKHVKQERKDGTSYIYHPMRVAEYLRRAGADIRTQIVAVLHDVLEDTDTPESKIKEFGSDIFEAVKLVTRPEGAAEDQYVAAILKNPMAANVKMMDKIDNVTDILMVDGYGNERTEKNRAKAVRYIEKARKYYYGKFSKALDTVIEEAEKDIQSPVVLRRIDICFEAESVKLYEAGKAEEKVEPEVVEPESAKPEIAEPESVKPEITESERAEIESVETEAEETEISETATIETVTSEIETAEPEITETETAETETAEKDITETETAEAEVAETEIAEPETTEPETTATETEISESSDEDSDDDDDDDGLEFL